MSKLQRNSPMPMNVPEKKGEGDEGTDFTKNNPTIVGQPELTGKNDSKKQDEQFNDRKNGPNAYTD